MMKRLIHRNGQWAMSLRLFNVVGLAAVFSLLIAPFKPLHAAFEDTGTGARPTVMGGTYVAVGDDVQSLMYNPAGLAQLHRHELMSEYSKLYSGLSDGSNIGQYFVGYGQPIRKFGGTLAAGWKQLSLDNLYTERTLSLGYGEWITQSVAAGVALKQLHHEFGAPAMSVDDNGNISNSQPTFFSRYGNASTAYSMDLGLLYRATSRHTFGLSIQDVNEPNVALNPEDHEIVSRTMRAGLSYKGRRGLTLAGSLTTKESLANQRDVIWTGAAEKWWETKDLGAFAARGSLATGSRSFQQMAMGASYRVNQYQIDYAFVFNLTGVQLGNTMGTHRFSFSYRFGPNEKETARLTVKKTGKKPVTRRAAKPRLRLEDIPELEDLPKTQTTQVPMAGQRRTVKPASEVEETAQMLGGKAPEIETPAPEKGPGLDIQVPAPVPELTMDSVDVPKDTVVAMPAEETAETESSALVEPLTREQFLAQTGQMISDYAQRSNLRRSAQNRLAALTPLYPTLKGYVMGGELLDQLDLSEMIDQASKKYHAMVWNGESAAMRLEQLTRSLESTLVPALKDRVWDTNDRRDLRYKAWLDQALARGTQLRAQGTKAHVRLLYWGQVVQKAQEFEAQPSEPVVATPVPPEPVVNPVMPVEPVPTVQPVVTPVQKAPVSVPPTTEKPSKVVKPVTELQKPVEGPNGKPLADGEWLYKVKEGDTLLSLAKRYYGDYNRWRDIYILNEDRLGRGGALRTGQLLVMPKKGSK